VGKKKEKMKKEKLAKKNEKKEVEKTKIMKGIKEQIQKETKKQE
jgi:hypothetical protein